VTVTIRLGSVLIDEGSGFILERLKGGRFAIMARIRGVGDNCLDGRRGILFNTCILRRGGGFIVAGVKWEGKGVSTPSPIAPFVYWTSEGRLEELW